MGIKWNNVLIVAVVISILSAIFLVPGQTKSFLARTHPFLVEWLPSWTVAAVSGLIIGALIRILRKL